MKDSRLRAASAALALGLGLGAAAPPAPALEEGETRMRAPELDGAVGWVGVEKPLRLADLRGKVVLLDFWTYG